MKTLSLLVFLSCIFLNGFSQTVILGTGTAISAFSPIIRSYDYCVYEVIYPAAEIGMAGTINQLAFERTDGTNVDPIDSVTIYMQHTTLTNLSAGTFSTTGYTIVYSGRFPNDAGSGWREVALNNPYVYDGIDNLLVLVVKGYQPAVGNTPVSPRWYYTAVTGTPARRYYGSAAISSGTNLQTTTFRSNARLDFSGVGTVEIGKHQSVLYPNPAGEVINIQNDNVNGTLAIIDAFGRRVYSANFIKESTVSVEDLRPGLYYLLLTDKATGITGTETFIRK